MKIQLKRSNVLESGSAKAPSAAQMEYGELAINYNEADPTLFIKDSSNNVIGLKIDGGADVPSGGTPPLDDNEVGDLFYDTSTNELKYWNGSEWVVISSEPGDGEGYVKVSGDNMTGDLTLGTDKITLNAADGSASFADGGIELKENGGADFDGAVAFAKSKEVDGQSTYIGSSGNLVLDTESAAAVSYPAIDVKANTGGPGGAIRCKNLDTSRGISLTCENATGTKTRLFADGSAEFAGGDITLSHEGYISSSRRYAGNSFDTVLEINTTDGPSYLKGTVTSGGGTQFQILQDGSASFAGDVTVSDGASTTLIGAGGSSYFKRNTSGIVSLNGFATAGAFGIAITDDFNLTDSDSYDTYLFNDGSATFAGGDITLNADGSATFAGGILSNQYFRVESENDAYAPYRITSAAGNVVCDLTHKDGTSDPAAAKGALFRLHSNTDDILTDPNISLDGSDGSATLAGGDITLNADGSARFAGKIYAGGDANNGTSQGSFLSEAGVIRAARDDSAKTVWQSYTVGNTTPTAAIYADGKATFVGAVGIGSNLPTSPKISLNPDGSATFSKDVAFGGNLTLSSNSSLNADGSVLFTGESGVHHVFGIKRRNNLDPSVYGFAIDGNGSTIIGNGNIALNHLGSAEFAGTITTQGGAGGPYVTIGQTIGFNLEADNPDNYTTTTEEYEDQEEVTPFIPAVPATYDEDGNELTAEVPAVEATYQTVTKTRDVSTYTGPVLDVKERLQTKTAALEAIKAAAEDASITTLADFKTAIATALANI